MESLKNHRFFKSHLNLYLSLNAFFMLNAALNWPIIKFVGLKLVNGFDDLRIVLRASDCFSTLGDEIYTARSGDCVYNYGSTLLSFLNFMRIDENDRVIAGYVLMFSTITVFAIVTKTLVPKLDFKSFSLIVLLFCSPPIMLLFERGNFDSLIFTLLGLSAIAAIKRIYLIEIILLSITASFKFYTLPALYLRAAYREISLRSRILTFVLVISTSYFVIKDLNLIFKGFSIPHSFHHAYGSSKTALILGYVIGFDFSKSQQILIGFLTTLIITSLAIGLTVRKNLRFTQIHSGNRSQILIVMLFAEVYLATYFAGLNYIYRLILILPVLIFLSLSAFRNRRAYVAISVISIWFSPWFYGSELIGDFALFLITNYLCWWMMLTCWNAFKTKVNGETR